MEVCTGTTQRKKRPVVAAKINQLRSKEIQGHRGTNPSVSAAEVWGRGP